MISVVYFDYRLTGVGCAVARIGNDVTSTTVTASYLSDTLALTLGAVASLLEGSDRERCSWAEEPGEYRWIFRCEGAQVHLRVLWFSSHESHLQADAVGLMTFETICPLAEVARAIVDGAQAVLDEHNLDGYAEMWALYPYPLDLLNRVQKLLASA